MYIIGPPRIKYASSLLRSAKIWMHNVQEYKSSVVVVVTLLPTKYRKTHICITHLHLSIPKMFACIVSVAARKSQGLSSWLPQHVTYNFCATARPSPQETTHWHPGGRFKESFYPIDFIVFNRLFCYRLYLDTCHFIKCLFNEILHLYGKKSLCISFHRFAPYSSFAENKSGGWYI